MRLAGDDQVILIARHALLPQGAQTQPGVLVWRHSKLIAHRLSLTEGRVRWEVQAGKGRALNQDQAQAMAATLCAALAPQLPGQLLTVEVQPYEVFAHGKTIDYERKFAYWQPRQQ